MATSTRGGKGNKRYRRGDSRNSRQFEEKRVGSAKPVDENSFVIKCFREFQKELDAKHDRHERIVKLSRDITIESKRIIFLLHRIHSGSKEDILDEAETKIKEINDKYFRKISSELHGEDPYQYLRAFSAGLQEYIEAVSFCFYLKHGDLIGLEEVQRNLNFFVDVPAETETKCKEEEPKTADAEEASNGDECQIEQPKKTQCLEATVHVPPTEFILGIADLTGELMRYCINCIGNGNTSSPFGLVTFMRDLYQGYQSFGNLATREITRKVSVLRQSLQKVEKACYTLQVRGSEMPEHMLIDVISSEGNREPDFHSDMLE
ncbi:translin-associated protein X-like [Ptychodera flava]|uniref:translin-associated protein X-like n=1 Tax=Ptychodera flava TaxID=63121 RepID=UPI00396A47D5